MVRSEMRNFFKHMVKQMMNQKKNGLNPRVSVSRGVATFSSDQMSSVKMDLSAEEIDLLREVCREKGFIIP